MKRIEQITGPLRGEIGVPGDKSIGHRAVIFASIAYGRSRIFNLSGGEDNLRTVQAFKDLGIKIWSEGDSLCTEGNGWDGLSAAGETIDCGNSGTAMRLLSGVLAGLPFTSRLDGDASLRQRPMQRVIDPLSRMGAQIRSRDGKGLAPLEIQGGKLKGIDYRMPVASAQVKSAILLAGLQAAGMTSLEEPQSTRNHTELMIKGFGGEAKVDGRSVAVVGGQKLSGRDVHIPGDISSAAFFLVAAAVIRGSEIIVRNVGVNPTRDGVIDVLRRMGVKIEFLNQRIETGEPVADIKVHGSELTGVEIGPEMAARTIDEYPILAVAGALAEGVTTISGVKELRYKESDRIATMTEGLRHLGVEVEEREDGMTIRGGKPLEAASVKTYGDHRVAMSLAIAGLSTSGGLQMDDAGCVDTSFPGFFELLNGMCSHSVS
ncbi:MAG TPA: 3-phosphoshikimate 1-carboxyvinyltransferase [Candidatus Binatia bacterium]|nr:3-phosphoshikimate 1-carboxyvinyltransferase [Candidatus Binatia bacterium]